MSEVPAGRATGLHRGLWAGAALFVLGLVLGAVATGLLTAQGVRPAQEQAADAVRADQDPTSRAGVVVTNACLRAINDAGDALAAIDDAAQAAAELNAARLDEVVRRLQPVQDRLESDLEGCEAVPQRPGEGATESSDAPLPGLSSTGEGTSATSTPTGAPPTATP